MGRLALNGTFERWLGKAAGRQAPGEGVRGPAAAGGIAGVLAKNPKVMLFDELASTLDPEMISEVLIATRVGHDRCRNGLRVFGGKGPDSSTDGEPAAD